MADLRVWACELRSLSRRMRPITLGSRRSLRIVTVPEARLASMDCAADSGREWAHRRSGGRVRARPVLPVVTAGTVHESRASCVTRPGAPPLAPTIGELVRRPQAQRWSAIYQFGVRRINTAATSLPPLASGRVRITRRSSTTSCAIVELTRCPRSLQNAESSIGTLNHAGP